MSESSDWNIPTDLQPRATQVDFDLDAALHSVVQLRSEIPEEAFTAGILGTERSGNGIVIRHDGRQIVLTIGYLITEAESIWLTTYNGRSVAGHPFAYDQATGFGLVLPLGELDTPSLELGSAGELQPGDNVIVIGHGDARHSLKAQLIVRREFAGYWEYLLEDALFTAPPHPNWGGTALLDRTGRLAGVGSLLIQETIARENLDANMFVPIDLLKPVLAELMQFGRVQRKPRPWLGIYAAEQAGEHVIVAGVIENSPAHRSGLRPGDVIAAIDKQKIVGLADFYRKLWACGDAGTHIPLEIRRGKRNARITVHSGSREDFLSKPKMH